MGRVTQAPEGELQDFAKADMSLGFTDVKLKPKLRLALSAASSRFEKKESVEFEDVVDALETSIKIGSLGITAGRGKVAYGFAGVEINPFTNTSKVSKLTSFGIGNTEHATLGFEYKGLSFKGSVFAEGLTLQAIQKLKGLDLMASAGSLGRATIGIKKIFNLTGKKSINVIGQVARDEDAQAFLLGTSFKLRDSELGLRYSQNNDEQNELGLVYRKRLELSKSKADFISEAYQVQSSALVEYKTSLGMQYWM